MDTTRDKTPQSTQTGTVWLVGAGPGDPGLATVRACQCIAEADVIVHDYLANTRLLEMARPDATRICAGKRAGSHSMPQDEINALLVHYAKQGKNVCRLKGGDPFLFGRGGEEALYLFQNEVPFEIVPGVTSAIAVPAYAGIPITHRGVSPSVRIITGHEDPSKEAGSVDWNNIADSTSGTLVFLMARRSVRSIANRLVSGVWPSSTPVAVIANGTLPSQKTLIGTLADIAERVENELDDAPALMVVGSVVQLASELRWFEKKPLLGKTLLVTRAQKQASEMATRLEAYGAEVISCPTIQIQSMADSDAMRSAIAELSNMDWVVFTSVNGVEAFFETLYTQNKDTRAFHHTRIAAIGPSTASRLQAYGIRADLTPTEFVAEALLEAMKNYGSLQDKRVLLPRSDLARPALSEGLREAGADVREVVAYKTSERADVSKELLETLQNEKVDLIVFTSSSTVRGFVNAIPAELRAALLPRLKAASIGPITTSTLQDAGIPVVVHSEPYTIPALVQAICRYFQNTAQERHQHGIS